MDPSVSPVSTPVPSSSITASQPQKAADLNSPLASKASTLNSSLPDPVFTPTNSPIGAALAQPVLDAAVNIPISTPTSPSRGKEMGPLSSEVAGFVEVAGSDSIENEPIPPEVASWMEKVNRGEQPGKLEEVVIADPNAIVLPSNNYSAQPVFVLPLGEEEAKTGLTKSVHESVRWLSEWCKYIVKKLGGQAEYNQN